MDSLFANFFVLDNAIQMTISNLMKDLKVSYELIWTTSLQETQQDWLTKFGAKCPKTVERFRFECGCDTQHYMEKFTPKFETKGIISSVKDTKKLFKVLVKTDGASEDAALYLLAGDEDDDSEQIKMHIEAKNRLTDQFVACKKNTAILAALENDEDGEKATFVKITAQLDE
jgi:hypothetical protein